MRGRRALLPCTVGVLLAHAALLVSVPRHTWQGTSAQPGVARDGQRLIMLDAGRVATLSSRAAPDAGASAPPTPSATAAAEAPASTAPQPAGLLAAHTAGLGIYRPVSALDVPIRPRSAPDLSLIAGLTWSGVPLQIRLFIDADGQVIDVQVLKSAEQPEVVERVRQMFLATGFTGGTEHGQPVPCFKDIELVVGNPA